MSNAASRKRPVFRDEQPERVEEKHLKGSRGAGLWFGVQGPNPKVGTPHPSGVSGLHASTRREVS